MKRIFPFAAAALALSLGACKAEVVCAPRQTLCDERCISTDVDAENCGGCGVRCRSHEQCDGGSCTGAPGATSCAGSWVDLVTNPGHCGACESACAGADRCRADGVLGTGCAASCPAGTEPCGRACVKLAEDRFHCGACGRECRRGESCRAGACTPDLYVACFATDDVRPADSELRSGIPLPAGDGPVSLAVEGPRVHVSSSLSHSVTTFATSFRTPGYEHLLGAGDLENAVAHGGRVYVSNSDAGTIVVMRGDTGAFVDEVALSPRGGSNPRGIAFVDHTAFVALGGRDLESGGHEIAVVDFSAPRGVVTAHLPVAQLASPRAIPSPTGVVALGGKAYVTIANLGLGFYGYTEPAGPASLAIVDASADPPVLSSLDLGPDCKNAGGIAVDGTTLWVACSWTNPLSGPPWFEPFASLLPIDVASGTPVVGTPVSTVPFGVNGPWSIAFCHGMGYVTDSWSGTVLRFDPSGVASSAAADVCPVGPTGWAFASSVACAP